MACNNIAEIVFCLSGFVLTIYAAFSLHSWIPIKYLQGSKNVRFSVARVIQHIAKKITRRHGSSFQFALLFFALPTLRNKGKRDCSWCMTEENAKINKLINPNGVPKMLRKELDQKFGSQ